MSETTDLLERTLSRLETHGWFQGNYTAHETERAVNPPTCLLGAIYAEAAGLSEFNACDIVRASLNDGLDGDTTVVTATRRIAEAIEDTDFAEFALGVPSYIVCYNDRRGREFSEIRDVMKRAIDSEA